MEEYVIRFKNGKYLNAKFDIDKSLLLLQVDLNNAQVFESFQFINRWIRNLNELAKRDDVYDVDGVYEVIFETGNLKIIERVK